MVETRVLSTAQTGVPQVSRARDGGYVIAGYGAMYDEAVEIFGVYELIRPIAMVRTLTMAKDVVASFNHNLDYLLGRVASGTLKLRSDSKGLFMTLRPPNTAMARHVVELIARGDLAGQSIMFQVTDERWSKYKDSVLREILDMDLAEIGPVVMPAYTSTTVGVTEPQAASANGGRCAWLNSETVRTIDRIERNRLAMDVMRN